MSRVFNVLVCMDKNMPLHLEQRFEALVRKVLGDELSQVVCIRSQETYQEVMLGNSSYNLVLMVDDLGRGNEFSQYIQSYPDCNRVNYIVVVPESCYHSASLQRLLDRGIFNALYERDLKEQTLKDLIYHPRNRDAAAFYYGLDFQMVPNSYPERTEERKTETNTEVQIVKRKVAEGVYVTRLHSLNAKKLNQKDVGDDDVLKAFLDGKDEFASVVSGGDTFVTEKMKLMEFELPPKWVSEYKLKLKNYFTGAGMHYYQSFEKGRMPKEEFEKIVKNVLKEYKLEPEQERQIFDAFIRDTDSYGKLDMLLDTKDITDIRLLNKDTVNVQYKGKWYRTNITYETEDAYVQFLNRICTKNEVSVNIRQAQIIFSDPDTNANSRLRFTVTHSLLNSNKTMTAHIRKIDKVKKTAKELLAEGLFDVNQLSFIINAVKRGKSIVICGGSGSGKTVALNHFIEYIPNDVCGVCVQEADELYSYIKENMEFQHSIPAKGEGKVEYTLQQLATNALLKNTALFIIGEIKGNEARSFFTAGNTGAQCMCTTHSDTCFDALPRLADLAKYEGDYSQEELLKMFSRSIDYVVHLEKYHINQIAGVVGWDDEKKDVIYDLYEFAS